MTYIDKNKILKKWQPIIESFNFKNVDKNILNDISIFMEYYNSTNIAPSLLPTIAIIISKLDLNNSRIIILNK